MDTDKIIEEVRRLAKENPNATYGRVDNRCFYTKGHAGPGYGCIFGQAILSLYPEEKKRLKEIDSQDVVVGIKSLLDIDGTRGSWCSWVQYGQDSGSTWEDSIKYADSFICE